MRVLPFLVLSTAASAVVLTAACSGPRTADEEFKYQVQSQAHLMVGDDTWPEVIASAHRECERLTGGNPQPWAADLLVLQTEGGVDEATADHIARAAVTAYCPAAAALVPAGT